MMYLPDACVTHVTRQRLNLFPWPIAGCLLLFASHVMAGEIRELPYPFAQVVGFASDIDEQKSAYGRAFHQTVNETLGLTVSDSLWIMARSGGSYSGIFKSHAELNDSPSGVGNHPVYGLLLREWHRGNIDHIHSWQDDAVRQIRNVMAPAMPLAATVALKLQPSPATFGGEAAELPQPQQLRLLFDAPPPDDLSLVVKSADGRITVIGQDLLRKGRKVQLDVSAGAHIVEILFGVSPDIGIEYNSRTVKPHEITEIEFRALSCGPNCTAKLLALERDGFSRLTAKFQSATLKAWNIRPALLTSHGGWTYHQNFGAPGDRYVYPFAKTREFENIRSVATTLADDKASHAYHSDVLRELGVIGVWPLLWGKWPTVNYGREQIPPPLSSNFKGLYTVGKTIPFEVDAPRDYRQLARWLAKQDPLAKRFDLKQRLCLKSHLCYQGAQGSVLGFLIELTLAGIDTGQNTNVLWHTHFGTAALDPTARLSPIARIHPKVGPAFRKLANYHFDLDGSVMPQHRAWVVPANVWVRYRIALAHAGANVKVDEGASAVSIAPWVDPVTRRTIPDPTAGTRDLHGLTIYVPDSDIATVSIGQREVHTFTRNPPDQTGRKSITIVNDNTPTVMLDEVASAALGSLTSEGGKFSEPTNPTGGAAYGKRFYRLVAHKRTGIVRLQPRSLELWNTTHLHFAYRKFSSTGNDTTGKLFMELEMDSGHTISVSEEEPNAINRQFPGWRLQTSPRGEEWRYVTLATASMKWPVGVADSYTDPVPLPIGRVREIRFGLRQAHSGDGLDIDGLMALRADGNGEAADRGKLVAGQVSYADGAPLSGARVEMKGEDGNMRSTVTNRHGYYFFHGVPPGAILAISSVIEGRRCAPLRGGLIDIRKNEAELDINLAACGIGDARNTRNVASVLLQQRNP